MKIKKINPDYFRNIIFGVEDSLVSTVGVLFGVSTAIHNKSAILLTGLIVISVEALSMSAGAFLTETTAHELETEKDHVDKPWIGGLIMFFSYFIAGFIPLLPYLVLDLQTGKIVSVAVTILALFLLGLLPSKKFTDGIRMAVVAGLAILIGFLIGSIVKIE